MQTQRKTNTNPPPDAAAEEAGVHEEAPLLEHLIELRRRLMACFAVFLAASIGCYVFAPQLYAFLVQPLADSFADHSQRRLIYTGLTEAFFTYMKLAAVAGFFIAFPFIASQAYAFLAPGLYRKERRVLRPYLVAAPALFLLGAGLAYYFVFPLAWHFFLSFETPPVAGGLPIALEARVSEYLGLALHLLVAFGLAFQLPVVLTLLCRAGLVQAGALARGRRFAIVIIAAASAVLSPPDAFSMIALMLPLLLLYEVSIWLCGRVEKTREAV